MVSDKGRRFVTRSVFTLVIGLALTAVSPSAQSLFGTISGTVVDEQGGALPGESVPLKNQAAQAVQHTTSNSDGVFVFAAVPAGTYNVKIKLQIFNSWEAT